MSGSDDWSRVGALFDEALALDTDARERLLVARLADSTAVPTIPRS